MLKPGVCVALLLAAATTASAQDKKPPYWASIASGEAMLRSGPGRNYPGIWLYKRRDLPIRVVQVYPNWRKIEDPDGDQGWMLVTLLSDRRTGIVKSGAPRELHSKADANSPVRYRAEQGVVGRLQSCNGSWCEMQVGKRKGWIAQADIWGVSDGEVFEE